ncbi:MAG: KdsC family phosphatase [Nitrospirales bacterium]
MLRSASRRTPSKILRATARTKVLKRLRLLALDVDGVLTDGGMYYGEAGEEFKKFQTRDGMGIKLLQAEGFLTAIVTGEKTQIVKRRAQKLGIPEVHQGIQDKLAVLKGLVTKYGLTFDQVAYMGDDVNDLEALCEVGFSGAPADCMEPVRQVVHYICRRKGGEGAVREVTDLILSARGVRPVFR